MTINGKENQMEHSQIEPAGCPTPGACSCPCDSEALRLYVDKLAKLGKLRLAFRAFMDHEHSRGHPLFGDAMQALKDSRY